jgi:tetratricopeptide (TPR) repeat protein
VRRPQRPESLQSDDVNSEPARNKTPRIRLPPRLLAALARAGHVHPTRLNEAVCYSSRDLRVIRVAEALNDVEISAPKILAALKQLHSVFPFDTPVGAPSGETLWESNGVRHRLPSILDCKPPTKRTLERREAVERRREDAAQHFENAVALEESDVDAARDAYMSALAAHSDHLEARINLGRLLHLQGNLAHAEKVYRAARHSSALLSFNLAILLEDLNREEEAVLTYREALTLDPTLHDAHFNLSRLHEKANRPQDALKHLLAYRRQRRDEES